MPPRKEWNKPPLGRKGVRVKMVSQKEMGPFYKAIEDAARDLHESLKSYECELHAQNYTEEQIDKKVYEFMCELTRKIKREEGKS